MLVRECYLICGFVLNVCIVLNFILTKLMKSEATPCQWFLKIRLQAAESGRILNLLYRREVGQDWPRFKPRAKNWERWYVGTQTSVALLAYLRIRNTSMRIRIPLFTSLRIRIRLFTSMRIRILLLPTKVIQIYDHWFTEPPRSPPKFYFVLSLNSS